MSKPPAKESHPGLFPPTFGAIAPFLADLDTTDGLGSVHYREDLSPSITRLAAECVQRGFPEVSFQPSSVVVVTWESVAPYQGPSRNPAQEGKVSTPPGETQLVGHWLHTGVCAAPGYTKPR
jgi:nidogen (entactin)